MARCQEVCPWNKKHLVLEGELSPFRKLFDSKSEERSFFLDFNRVLHFEESSFPAQLFTLRKPEVAYEEVKAGRMDKAALPEIEETLLKFG